MAKRINQKLLLKGGIVLTGLVLSLSLFGHVSQAADTSNFKPGNIISDGVMTDYTSMSVSQIQSFMDKKIGNNCDTDGSEMYNSSYTRAEIGEMSNQPPPYICLNKYKQGGLTSAQIIYNAAHDYHINPQALLVTLEKEQGLLTNEWPWPNLEYRTATGYGCPDGADCNADYFGFTNQVRNTAYMYHAIVTNDPDWYTPYLLGTNRVLWHPLPSAADPEKADYSDYYYYNSSGNMLSGKKACGYSNVDIQNRATQALYNYTPYRPNSAALQAGYGSGNSCSSYGNRNFWLYFNDWFGSSLYSIHGAIEDKYISLGAENSFLGYPTSNEVKLDDGGRYQKFQYGRIYWSSGSGAWAVHGGIGDRYISMGGQTSSLGYPISGEKATADGVGRWQEYQNGFIIWGPDTGAWESMGSLRDRWGDLGYQAGKLGYPVGPKRTTKDGVGQYQEYQNGFIIGTAATGYWESKGAIRQYWSELDYQNGKMGYPTGAEVKTPDGKGWYQNYQGGFIVGSTASGFWESTGEIRSRWGDLNYQHGKLGYPVGPVTATQNGVGRWQEYQNGFIIWGPDTGAWESMGSLRDRWGALGYQGGKLGYPTGPVTTASDGQGKWQEYQNGFIIWGPDTGAWESMGQIRDRWGSLGYQNGRLGYPTGPVVGTGELSQAYQMGKIYYSTTKGAWVEYK